MSPAAPPNIIFIMADDLGVADLGPYGVRDIKTPAADRLAREGLTFDRAYANSAVCSATRTALMTGRYQYRLRCGLEEPIAGVSKTIGLPPRHPTLPSLLRRKGYATTLVGKWHLGDPPKFGPLKSGYDDFYGFVGGVADYFTHQYRPGVEQFYDGAELARQEGYLTDLLGDRTVELIENYADARRRFMISLHFNAPHWPWEGPHDEEVSRNLSSLYHTDGGNRQVYGIMIERMDYQIGRVLDALDRRGLAENTIVIFTSDNGGERFSDTWPFIGLKGELLEGGLRVPALLRWPAQVPAGTRSNQAIMTMDWLPTLLAAARTSPARSTPPDGIDLSNLIKHPTRAEPRQLFWRYKRLAQRAHVDGDWKYLRIAGNEFLFNLAEDQRERANLKHREPETFARLIAAWEAWNTTMLPQIPQSCSWGPDGAHFADRYGAADDWG